MMEKCLFTQTHNPDYEAISMCSSLLMMEKCLFTQTHNPDYEAISMCSSLLMTCASWRSSKCNFCFIFPFLTRPVIEAIISLTRGEHANHDTSEVISI